MRTIPKLSEIPNYPVVAGTALLAIGVTAAWWAKMDISPLFATAMIRRGELWRLLSSILPHGGVMHLAFNIYWLWIFGTLIEDIFGHFKTALLFVLFAAGSSALEFAFLDGGIGLSGVGYGLFGLIWILSSLQEPRFRAAIDRRTIEVFIFWFFLCIVTTITGIMPIANLAHAGGAILGILTAFAIARQDRRIVATAGIAMILCFSLWAATLGRPKVNLSHNSGFDEGIWGYDALIAHRDTEALRWFHEAIDYHPKTPEYWFNLGLAYEHLKDKPAALTAFRKSADLGSASASFYLGTLYQKGSDTLPKDPAQALFWFRKVAAQDDTEALNSVAWEYATSDDPAIRNPTAALELARKTIDLEKDKPESNHLDTLAEAYFVNERYQDAVGTELQAIKLAGEDDDRSALQQSLEKYQRALEQQQKR
jgi:membrane associated rhomboid family serine protease